VDVQTLQKLEQIRENLKIKLRLEGKTFTWFWKNKIVPAKNSPAYFTFMNCLKGNGGDIREDINHIINEYLDLKPIDELQNPQKEEGFKEDLKDKLKSEGKTYQWFWENKLLETRISYTSFIHLISGYIKNPRGDVETIINEYIGEKF